MITEPLTLRASEGLPDWFVIERAEHEHKGWVEERRSEGDDYTYSAYCWSGRISNADIEGTAAEMRTIAQAIKARGRESWKRCAVVAESEPVLLWSPRNSDGEPAKVSLAVADALADIILEQTEAPRP